MNPCQQKRPRDATPTFHGTEASPSNSHQSDGRNEDTHDMMFFQSTADRIMADVQSAITTNKRVAALQELQKALLCTKTNDSDHLTTLLLEAGVVNVLILQLNALMQRHGSTSLEYELVCYCLDILLRASPAGTDFLQQLVKEDGDEFLDILTEIMEMSIQREDMKSKEEVIDTQEVQKSIVSILHTLSSSSLGSSIIIQKQLVLFQLVDILTFEEEKVDLHILQDALGLLKNLTYYQEDRRYDLMQVTRLLTLLTGLPHRLNVRTVSDLNGRPMIHRDVSRSPLLRLSAVFRNLAISADCRTILARQPTFLSAIVDLLCYGEDKATSAVAQQPVLRNTLNTFISLSMDSNESTVLLIFHDDGIFLRILKRFLALDSPHKESNRSPCIPLMQDPVVRKRSARAIRLIINEATSSLLIHDRELMTTLSDAAILDTSADVRSEAAEAFGKFAGMVVGQTEYGQELPQKHHDAVLDALTTLFIAASERSEDQYAIQNFHQISISPSALARAFREQAAHPSNRISLMQRSDLIEKAATIALFSADDDPIDFDASSAVEDICCAFVYLSLEEINLRKLCNIPLVLNALVSNATVNPLPQHASVFRPSGSTASQRDRTHILRRNYSITALLNLARDETNRRLMAKHPGLLENLMYFAHSAPSTRRSEVENSHPNRIPDPSSKDEVKRAIVSIAKYL